MTPEQRETLIQEIQQLGDIAWAGLVGEVERKYAVNAFTHGGAPSRHNLTIDGLQVSVATADINAASWLATQIGRLEGVYTLPRPDATLIGPVAADIIAPRINGALPNQQSLTTLMCHHARQCARLAQNAPADPASQAALRSRALAAYALANNRLPTQAEYQVFLSESEAPWAQNLLRDVRSRQSLSAEQLALHDVPEGTCPEIFQSGEILADWHNAAPQMEQGPLLNELTEDDLPPFLGESKTRLSAEVSVNKNMQETLRALQL